MHSLVRYGAFSLLFAPLQSHALVDTSERSDQWRQRVDAAVTSAPAEPATIRTVEGDLVLRSRLQALEVLVGGSGVYLSSSGEAGNAGFSWRPEGLGCGTQLTPVGAGEVAEADGLVRIKRDLITEEFSLVTDGPRQDFVLPSRPDCDGELALELRADGVRIEALEGRSDAVRLVMADGRELLYHALHVTDSTGAVLAAGMRPVGGDRLRITVEDAKAQYPVRIDPVFSDADWVSLLEPGFDDVINAALFVEDRLYVAGEFTSANGGVAARGLAVWNGASWSKVGGASLSQARALAWDPAGRRLYVGGAFFSPRGDTASNVAMWDGVSWTSLGDSLDNSVQTLAWNPATQVLYAGGFFSSNGSQSLNRVAFWNGQQWNPLGEGLRNQDGSLSFVQALEVDPVQGRLFAGGLFDRAGSGAASKVAVWNGQAWASLGAGINGHSVEALAWDAAGQRLFVGGEFSSAGGVAATRVASWSAAGWSAVGDGLSNIVYDLTWDPAGRLYAGGAFTQLGGRPPRGVAVWESGAAQWSVLGGSTGFATARVFAVALEPATGRVIAAGDFQELGGQLAGRIASYDGVRWSALGATGLDGEVTAMAWDGAGANLYIGGRFDILDERPIQGIARWNGHVWSAVGTGVSGEVLDLLWEPGSGRLFAAGNGLRLQSGFYGSVLVWGGGTWQSLGGGLDGRANALAWQASSSRLIAGGQFTQVGSTAANNVAAFDGVAWHALGAGVDGSVFAIATDPNSNRVFVGGVFGAAGGVPVHRVAEWTGSNWQALGSADCPGGAVNSLAYDALRQSLYAGGSFCLPGNGQSLSAVARWNGTGWTDLGLEAVGVDQARDLIWDSEVRRLFVAGSRFVFGSAPVRRVASWRGGVWTPLATGFNGPVHVLGWGAEVNTLFAAGRFSSIGAQSASVAALPLGPSLELFADGYESD